ncbi:MAG: hypothetical protein AAGE52_41470 [Myxococcota bacterium]
MRAAILALLVPCAGTTTVPEGGTSTPAIEVEASPAGPVSTERLQELEAQCRSTIAAATFQDAAEALSRVRAAIGSLCSIELVGETPLEWRVSCGSDDFFASGRHEFGETTPCEGGANAFACLGNGLRTMRRHLQHVDVAVVGHVDLQAPRNRALRCDELSSEGWAASPWSGRVRRDRALANQRLAWCRAARAAASVREGLGADAPLRVAAIGASSQWLEARMDPATEGAACPSPTSEEDAAEEGRCQSARRVDVLIRLSATPTASSARCTRPGARPEDVLYCLEECVSRPEATQSALANPTPFLGTRGTTEVRPRSGWYVARSQGAPGVELSSVLDRLQLERLRAP